MVEESIIIKIKKLIEKSQSTDSLQESETFMLAAWLLGQAEKVMA